MCKHVLISVNWCHNLELTRNEEKIKVKSKSWDFFFNFPKRINGILPIFVETKSLNGRRGLAWNGPGKSGPDLNGVKYHFDIKIRKAKIFLKFVVENNLYMFVRL